MNHKRVPAMEENEYEKPRAFRDRRKEEKAGRERREAPRHAPYVRSRCINYEIDDED